MPNNQDNMLLNVKEGLDSAFSALGILSPDKAMQMLKEDHEVIQKLVKHVKALELEVAELKEQNKPKRKKQKTINDDLEAFDTL